MSCGNGGRPFLAAAPACCTPPNPETEGLAPTLFRLVWQLRGGRTGRGQEGRLVREGPEPEQRNPGRMRGDPRGCSLGNPAEGAVKQGAGRPIWEDVQDPSNRMHLHGSPSPRCLPCTALQLCFEIHYPLYLRSLRLTPLIRVIERKCRIDGGIACVLSHLIPTMSFGAEFIFLFLSESISVL